MNFPQIGDTGCVGFVMWVEYWNYPNLSAYVGELTTQAGEGFKYDLPPDPMSPAGAQMGLSFWSSPIVFQFSTPTEVVQGQRVSFAVVAGTFGPFATNVRPV